MKHNPEVESEWIERLKAFELEEMSITQFCKKHHLKEHRFYYWRNKLKHAVPIQKTESPHTFIPLRTINQEKVTPVKSEPDVNATSVTVSIDTSTKNIRIEIKVYMQHD